MLWWKDREECCLCECTDCAAACRDCSEAAAAASTVGRQQTVSGAEPGGPHTPHTPHSSLLTPQHHTMVNSHPHLPPLGRRGRQPRDWRRWLVRCDHIYQHFSGWSCSSLVAGVAVIRPVTLLDSSGSADQSRPRLCKTQTDVLTELCCPR